MDDNEGLDIDPAIAEAMGFTGFGTQPNKKRKFNANDGIIDTSGFQAQQNAKGANSLPLGNRKPKAGNDNDSSTSTPLVDSATVAAHGSDPAIRGVTTGEGSKDSGSFVQSIPVPGSNTTVGPDEPNLQALRKGVKNERGDMVYFSPNFLEDPWKDLSLPKDM